MCHLFCLYYSIDASKDSGLCRYASDKWRKPHINCRMELILVDKVPRLFLKAIHSVPANTELVYNYGSSDTPWRQVTLLCIFSSYFTSNIYSEHTQHTAL